MFTKLMEDQQIGKKILTINPPEKKKVSMNKAALIIQCEEFIN